ncbi:MAG: Na+/H+ antiporter NhaC family protein [Bacillota bacterium]|nr:Na+/H+ antiporter NhaC family protein [Bacillota bacterium]
MGIIMAHHTENIISNLSDVMTEVMMDEDTGWLILVCGLMGGIIKMIEVSGGAYAFGEWTATKAKGRKSALMWTWALGIAIFIDDYLNSLTIGSCMKKLTDKYGVSREMLSYVTSSTAAPLCVLIPISTWGVFAGRIMVQNGWGNEGDEILVFIKTIPFNFYAWAAAILVPLVVVGIVPVFGTMKKAEERVANGGPVAPPGSGKIDISAGLDDSELPENPRMFNLFIPIVVLVATTIIFDVNMQVGVICTLVVCYFLFIGQKLMTATEFWDYLVDGLKNMILPLTLMVLAFIFANINDQIGFTRFVIDAATSNMPAVIMPAMIFLLLAITEFITGTNWGMYIIALPIVIPLAMNMGIPLPLATSAVLSAGVLGSHCCFYSDCTVITSAATGCDNFQHAYTQMTYGILAGVIAFIGFFICGFIMI